MRCGLRYKGQKAWAGAKYSGERGGSKTFLQRGCRGWGGAGRKGGGAGVDSE